jgi:hypothetical protein
VIMGWVKNCQRCPFSAPVTAIVSPTPGLSVF